LEQRVHEITSCEEVHALEAGRSKRGIKTA